MHRIFVIFGNNLNGIWDSYHGTNVGACSPKASFITMGTSLSRMPHAKPAPGGFG
jgi:hypothetical protein